MITEDSDKSKSYKVRAEILEKHLNQFRDETKPEAYEFISRNIDILKKKEIGRAHV